MISANLIPGANMATATAHLGSVSVIQIGEEYYAIKVTDYFLYIII